MRRGDAVGPIFVDIPSGYVKIAIESGHRNSGFIIENGGSFHSFLYVYQRVRNITRSNI